MDFPVKFPNKASELKGFWFWLLLLLFGVLFCLVFCLVLFSSPVLMMTHRTLPRGEAHRNKSILAHTTILTQARRDGAVTPARDPHRAAGWLSAPPLGSLLSTVNNDRHPPTTPEPPPERHRLPNPPGETSPEKAKTPAPMW